MNKIQYISKLEKEVGLRLAGYTIRAAAKEIGVSATMVQNVLKGVAVSRRVTDFIEEKRVPIQIMVLDQQKISLKIAEQ